MSSVIRFSILFIFLVCQAGSIAYVSAADVSKYLQDAGRFIEKGEHRSAIIQLKNALQQDKDNARARLMLGKVYLEVGHGPGAEKELIVAQKLKSTDPYLPFYLGRAYLLQGKTKEIVDEIVPPESASAEVKAAMLALKGDALLLQQKKDEAQRQYSESLKLAPKNSYAQTGMARIAVLDNKMDDALAILNAILAGDKKNKDARLFRGNILRRKGDMAAAENAFTAVLEHYPEDLNALISRGTVRIAQKKLQLAGEDIEKARQLAPNHPVANYLRAMLDYQDNKIASAQDLLQVVLRTASSYPPPYMLLGTIHYSKKEYEQAEYHLAQYVKYVPGHLPARKLLAATYIKIKQPDKAVSTLEPMLENYPKDAQLKAMLGSAYMQKGDITKGTEYLQQAAELAPDIASIRTQLALGHLAAGKGEQAEAELETAVDMGQGVYQADIMLVLLHLKKKEFDKAILSADKLQKKIPDNPLPLNLKGAAYLGKQDTANARKQFEQALKLKPDFSVAEMNLASLDLADKNMAQASNRFIHILSYDDKHVGAMLGLARLAEQAGDKAKAIEWLEKARARDKKAIEPRIILTRYYLGQGDANKALTITRELQEEHPDNPLVLKTAGITLSMAGERASAITNFEKYSQVIPGSPEPYVLIAGELYKDNNYKGAYEKYTRALQIDPAYLPAQIGQVLVEIKRQHFDKALALALNIQKTHSKSPAGFELEGDIRMQQKKYQIAAKAYSEAFNKLKSGKLALRLYYAYVQGGKAAAGYDVLESWLKDNLGDVQARLVLAGAYQTAEKLDQAIEHYLKIIDTQPNNYIVLNNLAWLYQETNKSGALAYAEKAYALSPEKPEVLDTYGWVLANNNNIKKGLLLLQEATSRAPHVPEIRYHMAVALHKAGRSEEARKELERLLRKHKDFTDADKARKLLNSLQ